MTAKAEIINGVDPLNVLRMIAAMCVFVLHSTLFTDTSFFGSDLTFIFRAPAWGGVWIFFLLGGYLAGKSFSTQRYSCNLTGAKKYYIKRVKKVLLPTWAFIFIVAVLAFPGFIPENPVTLYKIALSMYRGIPGVDGIGACWYIFVSVWFYLATPWFCKLMGLIQKKFYPLMFFVVWLVGMAFRFTARECFLDWYSVVYASVPGGADLYFAGVILAYCTDRNLSAPARVNHNLLKAAAYGVLLTLILSNCWIYNEGILHNPKMIEVYQYIYPSLYLLIASFYIVVLDMIPHPTSSQPQPYAQRILGYITSAFSNIAFEFYLFHSLVLNRISPYISGENALCRYLKLLLLAAVITIILSVGFHRAFLPRREMTAEGKRPA